MEHSIIYAKHDGKLERNLCLRNSKVDLTFAFVNSYIFAFSEILILVKNLFCDSGFVLCNYKI